MTKKTELELVQAAIEALAALGDMKWNYGTQNAMIDLKRTLMARGETLRNAQRAEAQPTPHASVIEKRTVHLQSIGRVPAIPAGQLLPGDVAMFNFGELETVVEVKEKSATTVTVTFKHEKTGKLYTHDKRRNTLVGVTTATYVKHQNAPDTLTEQFIEEVITRPDGAIANIARRIGTLPTGVDESARQYLKKGR